MASFVNDGYVSSECYFNVKSPIGFILAKPAGLGTDADR